MKTMSETKEQNKALNKLLWEKFICQWWRVVPRLEIRWNKTVWIVDLQCMWHKTRGDSSHKMQVCCSCFTKWKFKWAKKYGNWAPLTSHFWWRVCFGACLLKAPHGPFSLLLVIIFSPFHCFCSKLESFFFKWEYFSFSDAPWSVVPTIVSAHQHV